MTAAKKRRGRFIVLEGIDGAGTTTQMRQLVAWLTERGELAHSTHEPTTGPIGAMVRQILRGRLMAVPPGGAAKPVDPAAVALLFAADRLDHLDGEVIPLLDAGYHVICDRYVVSSLAYQSLDTDLRFVRQINAKALAPDLTIFIKVRPEVGMARIEATRPGRDSFEKLAIQRRVAKTYDTIMSTYRDGELLTIDGELSLSEVTRRVRAAVEALLR